MDKLIDKTKEKVDHHDFLIAWSTGMNDYEISERLGVSLKTVQKVKDDLFEEENTF